MCRAELTRLKTRWLRHVVDDVMARHSGNVEKTMKTLKALFAIMALGVFVAGASLASFDAEPKSTGAAGPHNSTAAIGRPDVRWNGTLPNEVIRTPLKMAGLSASCAAYCVRYMVTSNKECSDYVDNNEAKFIKDGTYEQERANCRRHRDTGLASCRRNYAAANADCTGL